MSTNNLKEIENDLNNRRTELVDDIVSKTITSTAPLIEKTKDQKYAGEMAKSVQDLKAINTNIPPIKITVGTAAVPEPIVTIRGMYSTDRKVYQFNKTTYREFEEGQPINLMLETKNVDLTRGYRFLVLAKQEKGKFFKRLVLTENIHFNEKIVNIHENEKLPPGKYDVFVMVFHSSNPNSIKNSKGEKILDIAKIEIKPPKTSTKTKEDIEDAKIISETIYDKKKTTTINSPTSHIHLITPKNGDKIVHDDMIWLEFETDLPTPFWYSVNLPGKNSEGVIEMRESTSNKVNIQFHPKNVFHPAGTNKNIKLKQRNNQKFQVSIFYPDKKNPGKSVPTKAEHTINIDIV